MLGPADNRFYREKWREKHEGERTPWQRGFATGFLFASIIYVIVILLMVVF